MKEVEISQKLRLLASTIK